MRTYQPLKNNWKIDEDKGFVSDQIKERVDSESWYTYCKGYPNIREEDVKRSFTKKVK